LLKKRNLGLVVSVWFWCHLKGWIWAKAMSLDFAVVTFTELAKIGFLGFRFSKIGLCKQERSAGLVDFSNLRALGKALVDPQEVVEPFFVW